MATFLQDIGALVSLHDNGGARGQVELLRCGVEVMKETLTFFFGLALLIAIAFFAELIHEAPPSHIVIATGGRQGGYFQIGQQLASRLERQGIKVELRVTGGSVENLKLLAQPDGPDFAFVQGGARPGKDVDISELRTLASIDLEPVWLFRRAGSKPAETLRDLAKLQIIGGLEGSGTRDLLLRLFEEAGVQPAFPPLALSNASAAQAWLDGRGEAFFSVALLDGDPWLQSLFANGNAQLVALREAEALARDLTFMSQIVIPRSGLSLKYAYPSEEAKLLATATNLVVRRSVSSAIKGIVLEELAAAHKGTRQLGTFGKFPNISYYELPPDDEAYQFFSSGPSLIRKYLPYWIATLIERFYAVLIPALAVLLPLSRLIPRWLAQKRERRIDIWYQRIRDIDVLIESAHSDGQRLNACLRQIDGLERQLKTVWPDDLGAQAYFRIQGLLQRLAAHGRTRLAEAAADSITETVAECRNARKSLRKSRSEPQSELNGAEVDWDRSGAIGEGQAIGVEASDGGAAMAASPNSNCVGEVISSKQPAQNSSIADRIQIIAFREQETGTDDRT